jgi:CubicO group peptidase (beta-lactamase class C family)
MRVLVLGLVGFAGLIGLLNPCTAAGPESATHEAEIDRYVHLQLQQTHTPGASVAVVRHGEVVLAKGYGLANVELSVPATKNSVYELLSVSKLFTAMAVLLLVDEGQVSLDEPVAKYLPGIPDAWQEVKVRHLLAHCSGIPDYTDIPPFFEMIRRDEAPAELLRPAMTRPLDFKPGSRSRYSNSNYFVLGMIVEKRSGMTLAKFLASRVFAPLGMTATRMNEVTDIIAGRASGYHWLDDEGAKLPPIISGYHGPTNVLQNAVFVSPTRKWAAGAVLSSAADLARWEQAIHDGKLLKKETWESMWQPVRTSDGLPTQFGLGTELTSVGGRQLAGYQGGGLAFNSTFIRSGERRLAVVVLCNQTTAPSKKMALRIASIFEPELSLSRRERIDDPDPKTTQTLLKVIADARLGVADPSLYAPEAKEHADFVKRVGPEFLGRFPEIKSLELLERNTEGANQILTYRTTTKDTTLILVFTLNRDGMVLRIQPSEE